MNNAYIDSVTGDPELLSAVQECLPKLQGLNALQIEKLIFYLKSLHGYYPNSESHIFYSVDFSKKLDELRNSEEQIVLQRKVSFLLLKALSVFIIGGSCHMLTHYWPSLAVIMHFYCVCASSYFC